MDKSNDLERRLEMSKTSMRRTLEEIQGGASKLLILSLKWKEIENVLDSAQRSVEERLKEVISKEDEVKELGKEAERNEKVVKDQFEELRAKDEELGKRFRDLELGKKCYEEKLREVELKLKQLEELKLKEEEFGLKEKGFEKRCRDFELEKKDLEKSVNDKLEAVGLQEKDLEKRLSECALNEERFGLKEKSLEKRGLEFELKEKAMEERLRDVEVTEKGVQKQLEEIKRKEDDFGLKERDFEKRCRDVELSENRLRKCLKDLESKSEQCEERFRELRLMEESVKTKFEELGEKEVELGFKMIHFEQRSGEFIMEETSLKKDRQDLEAKQKHNEECLREIKLKEKLLEESSQELARKYNLQFEDLECKAKNYDQQCMELRLKEKSVKDQFVQIEAKEEQLALKERHLEQRLKDFELNEKYLELRQQELEAKEKHYDECLRKVELGEKEIKELSTEHRRKYEQQSIDLELSVKKCKQQFRDLELKEKKLAEWSKELERKMILASTEAASSLSVKFSVNHSSQAHLRLCINMAGKDLQMALNECWIEHGSIGTEVAMALQLSADPAKLVLDAMEGFYSPHLSKGDQEFEGNVIRRSCLLLLEQLMKLSPEIKPHARQEAMDLALNWKKKLRVEPGHEMEVLGFLWLLACFQLADAFDADELVNFLVFVAQHIQTPELFKVLGLGDKITGLIRILVEKKQHMEAIRFIYAFERVNEFPPVPVLRDLLNHSWTESEEILEKGKYTLEAQNEARTKRIADLRAVVKCIEDHKLESEYLPQNLENLKDFIVSLTSQEANPALCAAPEAESETPPQQHFGIKRPRESIDIEISGDAHLGASSTGFSNKMTSKHPKGSEQVTPKGPGTSRNVKKKTAGRKENALVLRETHGSGIGGTKSSSARRFAKFECYDFKREKSEDRFQVDQIWALYSSHGMPKEYAQVKKIESTPVFKLHVALLKVCSSSKDLSHPLCCGIFKVNSCQTEVISCNVVSHQPRAEPIGKGRYAIYPRKGEVWAIYKSLDSEDECDIVEVVEDDAKCKKVVVLSSVDVSKSLYMAPRSLRSTAGGVIEIPETEYARFSHQIPALQHAGDIIRWRGYWELDPSAIPGASCLELS